MPLGDTAVPRTSFAERHRAAYQAIFNSQRERMLEAVVEAVHEKGYQALTVRDIVGRARVSRRTFYDQFADKEACFIAAFDQGAEFLMARIEEETRLIEDWREMTSAMITTYCETLAAEPDFAYLTHVAALTASPASVVRRNAAHDAFVDRYRAFHELVRSQDPSVPELSSEGLEILVGGMAEFVRLEIERGSIEQLPEHAPQLVAFAQAVIGGDR